MTRWAVVVMDKYVKESFANFVKRYSPKYVNHDAFTAQLLIDDAFIELQFIGKSVQPQELYNTEFTGAWVYSMSDLNWNIVRILAHRIGRYPNKMANGVAATWFGILVENEPTLDNKWYFPWQKAKQYFGE